MPIQVDMIVKGGEEIATYNIEVEAVPVGEWRWVIYDEDDYKIMFGFRRTRKAAIAAAYTALLNDVTKFENV